MYCLSANLGYFLPPPSVGGRHIWRVPYEDLLSQSRGARAGAHDEPTRDVHVMVEVAAAKCHGCWKSQRAAPSHFCHGT